jgi:hypothetical protein
LDDVEDHDLLAIIRTHDQYLRLNEAEKARYRAVYEDRVGVPYELAHGG